MDIVKVEITRGFFSKFNDFRLTLEYQSDELLKTYTSSLENMDEWLKSLKTWCNENNQEGKEFEYTRGARGGSVVDLRNKTNYSLSPQGIFEFNIDIGKSFLKKSVNQTHLLYLAWCFEKYELFLKELYIALGFIDHGYWLASDFGKVNLSEIPKWKDEDFQKQIMEKSNYNADSLRKRFAALFSAISEGEKPHEYTNAKAIYNHDYSWYILYVTQLRHHIVHTQGQIFSLEKFNEKLRKLAGQNGPVFNNFLKTHNDYFLKKEGDIFLISLLDLDAPKKNYKFRILCQHLINHAYLIYISVYDELKKRAV